MIENIPATDAIREWVITSFTAIGGLGGLVVAGKWVLNWWNSRTATETRREVGIRKAEVDLKRHSDELMARMLERANTMIAQMNEQIKHLEAQQEPLERSSRRLAEAIDHLSALINAPDEVAREAAERRSIEFLERTKDN